MKKQIINIEIIFNDKESVKIEEKYISFFYIKPKDVSFHKFYKEDSISTICYISNACIILEKETNVKYDNLCDFLFNRILKFNDIYKIKINYIDDTQDEFHIKESDNQKSFIEESKRLIIKIGENNEF